MKTPKIVIALACLLVLPLTGLAQLPSPTYGWNLGNTLEPPGGEGTWGPPATQNLINGVANAGFNTVRLPVAWNSHANQSTYQIDAATAQVDTAVVMQNNGRGTKANVRPRRSDSFSGVFRVKGRSIVTSVATLAPQGGSDRDN